MPPSAEEKTRDGCTSTADPNAWTSTPRTRIRTITYMVHCMLKFIMYEEICFQKCQGKGGAYGRLDRVYFCYYLCARNQCRPTAENELHGRARAQGFGVTNTKGSNELSAKDAAAVRRGLFCCQSRLLQAARVYRGNGSNCNPDTGRQHITQTWAGGG